MDIRRPRHFVVAAEESNFCRAELRQDIDHSTILRYVHDIEKGAAASPFLHGTGYDARPTEVSGALPGDVCEMFYNAAVST
jgi:hypothetical protein